MPSPASKTNQADLDWPVLSLETIKKLQFTAKEVLFISAKIWRHVVTNQARQVQPSYSFTRCIVIIISLEYNLSTTEIQ